MRRRIQGDPEDYVLDVQTAKTETQIWLESLAHDFVSTLTKADLDNLWCDKEQAFDNKEVIAYFIQFLQKQVKETDLCH